MAERAPRDRNIPERRKSSEADYSLMEFMRAFPDDAACLDKLWRGRFAPDGHHAQCPKCERERKFHRTKTRRLLHLRYVRATCPSAEGDDLRAVVNLAAPVVLRDVPRG